MRRALGRIAFLALLATVIAVVPAHAYRTPEHDHLETPWLEGLTPTPRAEAGVPFLDVKKREHRLHVLYEAPARLERYDLVTQSWVATILLPPGPTAFEVDTDGIYVAFDSALYAFESDGTEQRFLRNLNGPPQALFVFGSFLIAVGTDTATSIDKLTGELITEAQSFYDLAGASFDGQAVFCRSTSVSPADILRLPVNPDGTLGGWDDSPYHGDFPQATKTFAIPAANAVTDDYGIVYGNADLTFLSGLGGPFEDLDADGGAIVLLRGSDLVLAEVDFLRAGVAHPVIAPVRVFADGGAAFALSISPPSITIERILFSEFEQPAGPEPPDPEGLDFEPTDILISSQDVIFLLSAEYQAVFRWSIDDREWLEPIATVGEGLDIAISGDGSYLFVSYVGGEITRFDLGSGALIELPFVNSPQSPAEIATAGATLFVGDPSGAWFSHFTYDAGGALVSWKDFNYFSEEYVWSAPLSKMFMFRDFTSPNDLIWEEVGPDGVLGGQLDSPYHGDYPMIHPLRVDPTGTSVLLGSGDVFDAETLVHTDHLPIEPAGAAWHGELLYTIEAAPGGTLLRSWSAAHEALDFRLLPGAPRTLFATEEEIVVVTDYESRPRFWIRGFDLDGPDLAVGKTDQATQVFAGEPLAYVITVANVGKGELADVLVSDEIPFGLEDATWTCSGAAGGECPPGPGAGDIAVLVSLPAGSNVEFTLTATVRDDVLGTLRNRVSAFLGGVEEAAAVDATDVIEPPLFADGFESGDASSWSSVVPAP